MTYSGTVTWYWYRWWIIPKLQYITYSLLIWNSCKDANGKVLSCFTFSESWWSLWFYLAMDDMNIINFKWHRGTKCLSHSKKHNTSCENICLYTDTDDYCQFWRCNRNNNLNSETHHCSQGVISKSTTWNQYRAIIILTNMPNVLCFLILTVNLIICLATQIASKYLWLICTTC